MYSNETLKKLTTRQNELIDAIKADGVEKYHVKVMPKNVKVPCPNYGTCPVRNCVNCASCIHECYVIKAAVRFPWAPWDTYTDDDGTTRRKPGTMWAECVNAAIYESDRARFWDEIETAFHNMRGRHMRGWESGDNMDAYDVERQDAMCRRNPTKVHWSYTKTWDAVNEYIKKHGKADNNIIMFSVPFGMTADDIPNPYGMPTFMVFDTASELKASGRFPCPGKCQKCMDAGVGCPAGMDVGCVKH